MLFMKNGKVIILTAVLITLNDPLKQIKLDALLKLRQVCCDPRLLKTETTKKKNAKSAKLELLVSLIVELLEEGRRILLFSQFIEMLALIEDELNKRKLTYLKLTGKTKDRETPVKRKLKKNRNKNFSNPFSTEPA
jgi:SNF2 family DNA or RNA helicase